MRGVVEEEQLMTILSILYNMILSSTPDGGDTWIPQMKFLSQSTKETY